jgi:two-component system LytT family response regulator
MRAIILDDEKEAAEALKLKIKLVDPTFDILHVLQNPEMAINILNSVDFDVLFLDIDMPILNGFDVLDKLDQKRFRIVFVTAYNEYSVKAIRANIFDYLLKPVDNSELKETLDKLKLDRTIDTFDIKKRLIDLRSTLDQMNKSGDKIMLNSQNEILFVDLPNVIRIEADGNYCIFHLKNGIDHLVTKTIGEYEEQLNDSGFFRIHKTHLINLSHIKRFDKLDMLVEMNDGSQIELASRRRNEFIDLVQKMFHS